MPTKRTNTDLESVFVKRVDTGFFLLAEAMFVGDTKVKVRSISGIVANQLRCYFGVPPLCKVRTLRHLN